MAHDRNGNRHEVCRLLWLRFWQQSVYGTCVHCNSSPDGWSIELSWRLSESTTCGFLRNGACPLRPVPWETPLECVPRCRDNQQGWSGANPSGNQRHQLGIEHPRPIRWRRIGSCSISRQHSHRALKQWLKLLAVPLPPETVSLGPGSWCLWCQDQGRRQWVLPWLLCRVKSGVQLERLWPLWLTITVSNRCLRDIEAG